MSEKLVTKEPGSEELESIELDLSDPEVRMDINREPYNAFNERQAFIIQEYPSVLTDPDSVPKSILEEHVALNNLKQYLKHGVRFPNSLGPRQTESGLVVDYLSAPKWEASLKMLSESSIANESLLNADKEQAFELPSIDVAALEDEFHGANGDEELFEVRAHVDNLTQVADFDTLFKLLDLRTNINANLTPAELDPKVVKELERELEREAKAKRKEIGSYS